MPFDGTQLNETAAHLLRAKRYIEEHGWCQGDYGAKGGPRCVLGALRSACGVEDDGYVHYESKALAEVTGGLWRVPEWNDAPGRTVEEVYAAFDRAIALAMEAGDA